MNFFADDCVPYSQEACKAAAERLGLHLGDGYSSFISSDNPNKGCYAYDSGRFAGRVYYGSGGTTEQMKTALASPKYRPIGYDCSVEGK